MVMDGRTASQREVGDEERWEITGEVDGERAILLYAQKEKVDQAKGQTVT